MTSKILDQLSSVLSHRYLSEWHFDTSGGGDASVGLFKIVSMGVSGAQVDLSRRRDGLRTELNYRGITAGVGLGVLPVSISTSTKEMPNGGAVLKVYSSADFATPAAFEGGALLVSGSASALIGGSFSALYVGSPYQSWWLQQLMKAVYLAGAVMTPEIDDLLCSLAFRGVIVSIGTLTSTTPGFGVQCSFGTVSAGSPDEPARPRGVQPIPEPCPEPIRRP
jgi:hypothetical protein